MHTVNKHLSVVDFAIAFLQVDFTLTDRFDLGAEKLNSGLYFFVYEKLVIRAFVLSQNFYVLVF